MTDQWPSEYPTDQETSGGGRKPHRGRGFAIGAACLTGGLALGVVGIAGATGTPSTAVRTQAQPALQAQSATPVPGAPAPPDLDGDHGFGRHRFGGPDGLGGGMLHGQFVAVKPGGGYQTVQMQRGTATAVSATSITVKSEDGFTRSYPVDKDTLVDAGRDGITTIAVNDKVHVRAIGTGDSPTAAAVMDETKIMANHERFAPKELLPSAAASPNA